MNWIREAAGVWHGGTGGIIAIGRLGKALKPLVEIYGWPSIRRPLAHYLKVTELQFVSPERFAATYNQWILPEKPAIQPPRTFHEVLEGQRYRLVPDDAA